MEKALQVALAFALLLAGAEIGKRLAVTVMNPTTATTPTTEA